MSDAAEITAPAESPEEELAESPAEELETVAFELASECQPHGADAPEPINSAEFAHPETGERVELAQGERIEVSDPHAVAELEGKYFLQRVADKPKGKGK